MKTAILVLSILANIVLAGLYLSKEFPLEVGVGQYSQQDGYTAMINEITVASFGRPNPSFYRYELFHDGREAPIYSAEFKNASNTVPTGARDLVNPITWQPDGSVKFVTPEAEIVFKKK